MISLFKYNLLGETMFAIICLNVMLLISCWYLIAENQKNKTQINEMKDDLKKAIERIAILEKNK